MKTEVILLGRYSQNSQMGGRVFSTAGLAPTIMAGTHGYGFGCILVYEDDKGDESCSERDFEGDKGAVL